MYHAIYESKLSKLIIIIIIYFTLFNFVIYSWTDNIPQEDLAIFGYTPDTKVKHLRIMRILATYLLETVVEIR